MPSPLSRSNPFAVVVLVALLAAPAVVRPPRATPAADVDAVPAAAVTPATALSETSDAAEPALPLPSPAGLADPGAGFLAADLMEDAGRNDAPVQQLMVLVDGQPVPLPFVDLLPAVTNGRTVLVLRDQLSAGESSPSTISALVDAGFRVIVPGRVTALAHQPAPERVALAASHLTLLLDSLGATSTAVVAEGESAAVAVRLAERAPRVRRLVLVERGGAVSLVRDGRGAAVPMGVPASFSALLLAFLDE